MPGRTVSLARGGSTGAAGPPCRPGRPEKFDVSLGAIACLPAVPLAHPWRPILTPWRAIESLTSFISARGAKE
jgi:hypothetical protein